MDFFNFNLAEFVQFLAVAAIPFMFAITVHEVSHAYAAYLLGDNTAKSAGRLTLNPIAHIDPVGLLVLLVTRMFGWAKPVPIDYRIVAKRKYGLSFVALAGPLSNIILAAISLFLLYLFVNFGQNLSDKVFEPIYLMLLLSIRINVILAAFNMIPIPPLDGSKVVMDLLPKEYAYKYMQLERYGFFLVIILIMIGAFRPFLTAVMVLVSKIIRIVIGV